MRAKHAQRSPIAIPIGNLWMRKKFGYDVSVRLPVSTDKGGGRGETLYIREGNLISLEATNRVASVKILKFLVFNCLW